MPPDVPRRPRPGHNERVRHVLASGSVQTASGATGAARRVLPYTPRGTLAETGGVVVTGTGNAFGDSASITSTVDGDGSSQAPGRNSVALAPVSNAQGDESVAAGYLAVTGPGGFGQVAAGFQAEASGDRAVSLGNDSHATGDASFTLGPATLAAGLGSGAIGAGASTSTDLEIALGAAGHIIVINGKLVIKDSTTGLLRQIVSNSGTLSTVAYP